MIKGSVLHHQDDHMSDILDGAGAAIGWDCEGFLDTGREQTGQGRPACQELPPISHDAPQNILSGAISLDAAAMKFPRRQKAFLPGIFPYGNNTPR
jgi:hypothetical protein